MDNNYIIMTEDEMLNILNQLSICILVTNYDNYPQAVPVYYRVKRKNSDIIIEIKSNKNSSKILAIIKNSSVGILFYNHTDSVIETITVKGKANIQSINQEQATIYIKIEEMSGRKFYN